ncbi:MAG TPA: lipid-binding SYLF domain-containing protein [Firmicutes bacterium]|nr:lipid-binding SYLF domain-containing protein [Bacillota bacterium]
MRKRRLSPLCLFAAGLLALVAGISIAAPACAATPAARLSDAASVLQEMAQQSDVGALARLLKKAKGVVVFPAVIKAGLVVGGRYGEGLLLRHDPRTGLWYGPHFVTLKGLSYGPQFGFQSTALVLVVANDEGMKGFRGDKVTLGGDVSVAAGPVGRHAEASTDADLKASIYSYSMSKGIFAGLSLEGAVIAPDDDANALYWHEALQPDQILARRASGAGVEPLLRELERLMEGKAART